MIDQVLTTGTKSGYKFTYVTVKGWGTAADPYVTYTLNGDPVAAGSSGQSAFFSDESGVIRKDPTGAAATVSSNPLQ